jgi:hypothetical protein
MNARQIIENTINQLVDDNTDNIALSLRAYGETVDAKELQHFIKSSLSLYVLTRCGVEPSYFSSDFEYINQFTSPEAIQVLGERLGVYGTLILNKVEKAAIEVAREVSIQQPTAKTNEVINHSENLAQIEHNNRDTKEQQEANQERTDNKIIGNTPYRYVPKKKYRKYDVHTALLIAEEFTKAEVKFSGRINDDDTLTLTFDGNRITECEKIIEQVQNREVVSEKTPLSELVLSNLPNNDISLQSLNDFGYTDNIMLPISQEQALEYLNNKSFSVYLLYDDSTEGQALTQGDILQHKGMFGIEVEEWEKYITPPLEKAKAVAEEQGLPFSERMSNGADDIIDPFAYDGTMSLEDFRQAQENYLENENLSDEALSEISTSFSDETRQPIEESPIHFGLLGNGITVYDTSRIVDNDYPTIAHISDEGDINYYEQNLKPEDIALIEKHASKQKATETVISTNEIDKAVDRLINNHSFSDEAKQFINRVGKYLNNNGYTQLDLEAFTLPVFVNTYGTVSYVNNKLFDGQLKDIVNELNEYLNPNTELHTDYRIAPENYHITDNNLGIGTPKEKYHNNIEAIKTLYQIEAENRTATPSEQEILSKYVGWGGYPMPLTIEKKVGQRNTLSLNNCYPKVNMILLVPLL